MGEYEVRMASVTLDPNFDEDFGEEEKDDRL